MSIDLDQFSLPWTVELTADEDGNSLFGVVDADEGFVCYSHSDKIAQAIVANAALIRATAGYPSPGMAGED
ncbi:MAG: hypothetical protein K0S00_1259 [Xanthobacteraceae bacterium]|jgi:hypothetical protein|nr:hypothetical protein [Xanthobacteraceae bacterium]